MRDGGAVHQQGAPLAPHVVFDVLLKRLLLCAVQQVALQQLALAQLARNAATVTPPASQSPPSQVLRLCVSRHRLTV